MKTFASSLLPSVLVLGLVLVAVPGSVPAAGFGIYEQGAKASAMGGAFAARADDASANWYNPAALVWLEGSEIQVGLNLINAGDNTDLTSSDPRFGLFAPTTFDMEANFVTPAHVYYRHSVSPSLAFGIGINNPFGLVTEWVDRPVTFAAQRSELVTFYVNPNVAFRVSDRWSVAVGLDYVVADLEEFSREVPIDLDGNPRNGFEVIGRSNLTGDGEDLGWNVAAHHRGDVFSFGLTYRSDVTVGIDGRIAFDNFGPLTPFFQSSTGSADLDLPDHAVVALAWDWGTWAYEVDLSWIGWSVFETLAVDIDNNVPGFVEDIALREDWDDSISARFGLARRNAAGSGEWRFGLILEEGVVPPNTLRPSIPDGDRVAPTIGYGFMGSKLGLDLYYMALFIEDISAGGSEEGLIRGEYSSFVNLAGATLSYRF